MKEHLKDEAEVAHHIADLNRENELRKKIKLAEKDLANVELHRMKREQKEEHEDETFRESDVYKKENVDEKRRINEQISTGQTTTD